MSSAPRLEYREAQPYVAIPASVTMQSMSAALDQLFPEIMAWAAQHGAIPAGALFIRYNVIDMEDELQIEVGVPVATPVAGDGRVQNGVIPAGRYVTTTHVGPYSGLVAATGELLAWAQQQGIQWQTSGSGKDEVWGGRFEFYPTDPADEPDESKWETELVFLTNDTESAAS